jgi:drug/metabolite transporter (DMT)-like permease
VHADTATSRWIRLAPVAFVLLWSTGFIAAKAGVAHAGPFTLLFYRFVLTVALLLPLARLLGSRWPERPALAGHIAVAGLLLHAGYLGGVFAAIAAGMPAGMVALIVGLQPLVTATAAGPLLGEQVRPLQWLGLAAGFGGVALVVAGRLEPGTAALPFAGFGVDALACTLLALFAITGGTLYQKRFCTGMDLVSGAVIQYAASGAALGVLAVGVESLRADWGLPLLLALAWLVLVLSIAAIGLLLLLIRRGAASRVASLFYLVPPVTALEAWWLFDERLGPLALAGMAVIVGAVFMVFHLPAGQRPAA